MDFVRLAKISDFSEVSIKSYQVVGKFIAIVRDGDASYYATEIGCKHNNADLTSGQFNGDIVTCPRHGWRYDIRTGACLNQDAAPLRRHGLKIEGEDIFVSIAPSEEAAPSDEDDDLPTIIFKSDAS